MFGIKCKTQVDTGKVKRAYDRGTIWSLGRAGAYIYGIARKSIKIVPEVRSRTKRQAKALQGESVYAAPGDPPHSRRGKLKQAIFFAVEGKTNVAIGTSASRLGQVGRIHEHGGRYRVRKAASKRGPAIGNFPKRPFMAPALEVARVRLPSFWAGSVKE